MEAVLYIIAKAVQLALGMVMFCMFLRVILQFFVDVNSNKIYAFCVTVSELFVMPFRAIMAKLNIFQNTPLDAPFMVAYIFLSIITAILPAI